MKYILCIVAFALGSSVCANAQTIADLARRERAKRQAIHDGLKVTNENLPAKAATAPAAAEAGKAAVTPGAESSAPPTSPAKTAVAAAKPAATPEPAGPAQNEQYWRGQFEEARAAVRRAENQVALAQIQLNAANRDYQTRAYDPDGRGPAAIAAAKSRLAGANQDLENARARVAQLQDDLRRSGAPAGWGR